MSVLNSLIEKNAYPIVFIGSGISKRYVENFPNWNDLILTLWKKAFQKEDENDFYIFMNSIRNNISTEFPNKDKEFINYKLNIMASSIIEVQFNKLFLDGKIKINNYNAKDYFEKDISPFKIEISNLFSNLKINEDKKEEFEIFKKFLSKTKIILTTNYDELIEEAYNSIVKSHPIDTYVGQEGFLRESIGYAELYKIHGSCKKPNSIIITNEDYENFQKNSVLISAKIISSLITSPIIFLGYSLTDENVRSIIIRDFSGSLSEEDFTNSSERIIVVERLEQETRIKEHRVLEKDLGIELTLLKTDNYKLLFESLNNINEGVSSAFINRYSTLLKELIIERGKEGTLETLLVSPTELSELETNHQLRKNAAVVMGDAAIVYTFPSILDYFLTYFSNEEELNTNVALHFISSQNRSSNIPFWKYIKNFNIDNSSLNSNEKDKIKARKEKFSSVEKIREKISSSNSIKMNSFSEIQNKFHERKKKTDIISFNINILKKKDVLDYIISALFDLKETNEFKIDTPLRRLCTIYDVKYNK